MGNFAGRECFYRVVGTREGVTLAIRSFFKAKNYILYILNIDKNQN